MDHFDFDDIQALVKTEPKKALRLHWEGGDAEALETTPELIILDIDNGEYTPVDFNNFGYCVSEEEYLAEENEKSFLLAKIDFGSVVFGETEYALTEYAHIDARCRPITGAWVGRLSDDESQVITYRAAAIDSSGNEYAVLWAPVEGFADLDDESDCCDWDKPVAVITV